MRPSSTTSVSAPSTTSPSTARALRSALSTTTRRGSPPVSSSAPEISTRNGMPSCSRTARRWGDPLARMRSVEVREEESHFALPRLRRVGAVDHVLADLEREVAADRAGRRLERVRRADHLARRLDRLVALEHERDERGARDELDQL